MSKKSLCIPVFLLFLFFAGCSNPEEKAFSAISAGEEYLLSAKKILNNRAKTQNIRFAYSMLVSAKVSIDLNDSEENHFAFLRQLEKVEEAAGHDLSEDKLFFSEYFTQKNKIDAEKTAENFYSEYKKRAVEFTEKVDFFHEESFNQLTKAAEKYTKAIKYLQNSNNEPLLITARRQNIEAFRLLSNLHILSQNINEVVICFEQLITDYKAIGEHVIAEQYETAIEKIRIN